MCNRVGPEGEIVFAGQSLVAGPDGGLLFKAGGDEALLIVDVPLEKAARERAALAQSMSKKRQLHKKRS